MKLINVTLRMPDSGLISEFEAAVKGLGGSIVFLNIQDDAQATLAQMEFQSMLDKESTARANDPEGERGIARDAK